MMMKKSVMNSPSSLSLFYLLLVTILVSFNTSFRLKHGQSYQSASSALYYDYFKKGPEKKDVGRLWKNILFPGIFVEYADTKEALKTVKVETKTKAITRNDIATIQKQLNTDGKYNVVDASTAPKIVDMTRVQEKILKPVKKPANFVAPTPKKAVTINLGSGLSVLPDIGKYPRPKKPIIIYEFEASGECKKVREACSILDLVVEFRPCPGGTSGFSDSMSTFTLGRREVPFMVDNNPSMYKPQMYGSADIISFLFNTYGPGEAAIPNSLKGKGGGGGGKGAKVRVSARPDNTKMRPITIYGWEGAQYVKQVRETLNELALPHVFINCANGSKNRASLVSKTGIFQVPFISDPNTGVEMFESAEIVKYLDQTYTA